MCLTGQIHKFRIFDKNIVLDVNSGSVFEVDDLVYDVLDYYDKFDEDYIIKQLEGKYTRTDILEALAEIGELKANHMIYTEADFSSVIEQVVRKAVCKSSLPECSPRLQSRCKVLFCGQGDYHGRRELMSKEVGRNAVDFLVEQSGNIKNLEIDFSAENR